MTSKIKKMQEQTKNKQRTNTENKEHREQTKKSK